MRANERGICTFTGCGATQQDREFPVPLPGVSP